MLMSLKKLLLLTAAILMSLAATAQVKVTGVVISAEDNEPVIGAHVSEKSKPGNGTATDIDGKFTLTVASSKSVLVVKYTGLADTEVQVTQGEMRIVMAVDSETTLDEVVVTGYQNVDKRLFTGATSSIKHSPAGKMLERMRRGVLRTNHEPSCEQNRLPAGKVRKRTGSRMLTNEKIQA